jgi:hypothetical protein
MVSCPFYDKPCLALPVLRTVFTFIHNKTPGRRKNRPGASGGCLGPRKINLSNSSVANKYKVLASNRLMVDYLVYATNFFH